MERNELAAENMVSCIFTCTDDLDAEFPALAARRLGLDGVPLLCAREIDVPGGAAAGDQAARALLRRARDTGPPRVPARGGGAAARPRGRAVTRRVQHPRRATSRSTRRPPRTPTTATWSSSPRTRLPGAPHPQVLEAVRRRCAGSTAIPDPGRRCCGSGSARALRRARRARHGRQRLVRDPARRRRGDARAGRRDRLRVAVVLDVPAPGGDVRRARGHRPARRRGRATTSTRWPREVTAATASADRLQPQQPDRHRAAAARDRRVLRRLPPPRGRDPRRGLRRVPHAPGPGRVARPARRAPEPRAPADVLEGATASAGCGWATRSARPGLPRRGRRRAPAVLASTRSPRRPPPRRSAHRTRWSGGWSDDVERMLVESGPRATSALELPDTRGELLLGRPRRARRGRGRPRAGRAGRPSCAPAPRSAEPGHMRVTYGTRAENDRFLGALAELRLSARRERHLLQTAETVTRTRTTASDPAARRRAGLPALRTGTGDLARRPARRRLAAAARSFTRRAPSP